MPNINKYVLAVPITAILIILALLVGSAIFQAKGESDKNAGQVSVEKEKVDNSSTIAPPKQIEPKREDTSSNPQDRNTPNKKAQDPANERKNISEPISRPSIITKSRQFKV